MKYFLILLTFVSLVACSDDGNKLAFTISRKSFKLNFEPSHTVSGLFGDSTKKNETYFFGELVTAKKIDLYDVNFKLKKSINLKKFIEELGNAEIQDAAFINKDSLLLFSEMLNTAFLIDAEGKLLKKMDINSDRKDFKFDLYSTMYNHFYNPSSKSMIFAQGWSARNPFPEELTTTEQIVSYGYNQKRLIPKFVEVKDFLREGSPVTVNHLKGFNAKIFPKNSLSFEFDYYFISKNLMFFSSWYSDKVFVYDLDKKEVVNELSIKSKYTQIGAQPMTISANSVQNINDYVKECGSFKGQINRIFYDSKNDLLYVMVYHEQKNPRSQFYGVNRDWSLIVYKNLNEKIYEKKFTQGEYAVGFSMLTKSGLWIRKFNKKAPATELVFDCFTPVFDN